jgi:DNA processing protein
VTDISLRLAIQRITVLRPHEKLQLEEIIDSEAFFLALSAPLLSQIVGRKVSPLACSPEELLRLAEHDQRVLAERGITALHINDRHYPAQLREIFDPPYMLYLRGTLPAPSTPLVAIVGTREPTAPASLSARRLGRELAEAGIPVVSGLARGIDVAAHQGALGAGVTGAVLACGADAVYPKGHRRVAARIIETGGFLVSEYPPGVAPLKYHFPARNRIISGLARAVVVVQAPAKSGALITADYALDHGRDLAVHAVGLEGVTGQGTKDLAADGALIVSSGADVLAEWGVAPVQVAPQVNEGSAQESVVSAAAGQVAQIRALLETRERLS